MQTFLTLLAALFVVTVGMNTLSPSLFTAILNALVVVLLVEVFALRRRLRTLEERLKTPVPHQQPEQTEALTVTVEKAAETSASPPPPSPPAPSVRRSAEERTPAPVAPPPPPPPSR